jgi:acetylornithine deacetylase/succinyl-diaminopimelate desuccinylase family protein
MLDDRVLRCLRPRRAVELTKGLVRAQSINPPGRESLASAVVSDFLDEIGIAYVEQSVSGDRQNIVATLKGRSGSPSLLLTSHLDVVPPGDTGLWLRDPFSGDEVEGQIYGRGSADAKGSLGAMLSAIEAVAGSGIGLSGDLVFAAVVGEETDELGIKHLIEKEGLRPDMALVGEPTRLRVGNAHKGFLRMRIDVRGRAAHSSLPESGLNAISGMAQVIMGLEALAGELQKRGGGSAPTLVVSTIAGGIKDNVVPPSCAITVDRRLIVGEHPEMAEEEIRGVVRSALEGTSLRADVEPYLSAPPAQTSAEELIVRSARAAVKEVLGEDMGLYSFEAYCDMGPLVDLAGTRTVILGPGSLVGSHVTNEMVPIREVEYAAKIYSLVVTHALCV